MAGSNKRVSAPSMARTTHDTRESRGAAPRQVNARLRKARDDRGWTQEQLGERVGVSGKTINYWENGAKRPQPYNLGRLCAALGMSAEELGFDRPPRRSPGRGAPATTTRVSPAPPITASTSLCILPAPIDQFVGREGDIARILDIFGTTSSLGTVVAIMGISGLGKSALAAEALHRLAATPHRFTQGIVYIPCAERHGLDGLLDVYTMIASTWRVEVGGVAQYATRPEMVATCYEAELRAHLHFDNRALVLLDDVKPGLPLARLLNLCKAIGLSVLLTTVPMPPSPSVTKYIDLSPLSTAEAVRLFAQQSRAFGMSWRRETDGAATRTLVQRLGYLPIAIHLAAKVGFKRGLTPDRLAREVDGPDALRHLRDPTNPDAGIRDLFARLLTSLPTHTQLAFAALGLCEATVIPAPIAGALMERVLASAGHPRPAHVALDDVALSSLIRRTWDDAVDEPIVSLHSLVHAFARERWRALAPPLRDAAVAALVARVAEYVAGRGSNEILLTMHKALILGALRQGMRHGLADERVTALAETVEHQLEMTGDWRSLCALLRTRQRAARRGERHAEEGRSLAALGMLAYYQGRRADVLRYAHHALHVAEHAKDDAIAIDGLDGLGTLAIIEDRLDESERYYALALEMATRRGDARRMAQALVSLGDVMARRWAVPEALDYYHRALARAEDAGDRKTAGYAHMALGHQAFYRDDLAVALGHFTAAHTIALGMRNRQREAYALRGLGYVATRHTRLDEALDHFKRSAQIAREIGNRVGEADALRWMGDVLSRQGHHAEGEEWIERGMRMCRRLRQGTGESHALRLLGALNLRRGEFERARQSYLAAHAIDEKIGDIVGIGESLMGLGDAAAALDDIPAARTFYERALVTFGHLDYFEVERVRARLRGLRDSRVG